MTRVWSALKRLFSLPAILVVIGLFALIDGIWIAHDAEAATPLLAIGAVAIVLAWLVLQPGREVHANWGEFGVVIRSIRGALQEVSETGQPDEVPELLGQLSSDLERVENRVKELASDAGSRTLAASTWGKVFGQEESPAKWTMGGSWPTTTMIFNANYTTGEQPRALAHYTQVGDDRMALMLEHSDPNVYVVTCRVHDPDGIETSAMRASVLVPRKYGVIYPTDFHEAPPLKVGTYRVEWFPPDETEGPLASLDITTTEGPTQGPGEPGPGVLASDQGTEGSPEDPA